jgi:hypothetical protein
VPATHFETISFLLLPLSVLNWITKKASQSNKETLHLWTLPGRYAVMFVLLINRADDKACGKQSLSSYHQRHSKGLGDISKTYSWLELTIRGALMGYGTLHENLSTGNEKTKLDPIGSWNTGYTFDYICKKRSCRYHRLVPSLLSVTRPAFVMTSGLASRSTTRCQTCG